MKTLIKIHFIILLLGCVACQSNDPNHLAEERMHDEVMVVHDEVMPKMGEINSMRKKLINLSENNDSLKVADKVNIKEAISYLEKADDGMMDWMAEYTKPSKLRGDKTHEEIMAYLKAEEAKVQGVKSDMLASISAAKDLLQKYGDEK